MRYLLLCCFDEGRWAAIPEPERAAIMQDYATWTRALESSGRYLAGAKLAPTSAAISVRAGGVKPVLTDGPFAETREQIGGYHLIECSSREEAVAIASRIPPLRAGGTVEVREVVSSDQSDPSPLPASGPRGGPPLPKPDAGGAVE